MYRTQFKKKVMKKGSKSVGLNSLSILSPFFVFIFKQIHIILKHLFFIKNYQMNYYLNQKKKNYGKIHNRLIQKKTTKLILIISFILHR